MSQPSHNSPPTSTPASTPSTTSAPAGDLTTQDMIDFMSDETEEEVLELPSGKGKTKETPEGKPKETVEEEEEPTGDEEETPDELEEIEQELEGPTEEQLELVTPVRRKEILAKYPNLFKDFPYLEKAYYREQQFTELLPTIDDAKEAVEARETLQNFEREIMEGKTETVLKAVKEENPKGFNKLVDNYLIALANVDERAYQHVLGNTIKHTIIAMVKEAKTSNNEVLQSAAQILNQFVFGKSDFEPPSRLSGENEEKQPKDAELSRREQEFVRQQFESVRSDLNSKINNSLRATIDAYIDPKKSMSEYVRKNAAKDALENLEQLISKDARFRVLADKLWEKAFQSNFSPESRAQLKSAFLSKAKTLLPSVIKKARNEALRGIGKRVSDEEESTPDKRGPVSPGRPRSQSSNTGKSKSAPEIPKGMSTLEFLNSD